MITAGYSTSDGSFFTDKTGAIQHEQQLHIITIENLINRHWDGEDMTECERRLILSFITEHSDSLADLLREFAAAKAGYIA